MSLTRVEWLQVTAPFQPQEVTAGMDFQVNSLLWEMDL